MAERERIYHAQRPGTYWTGKRPSLYCGPSTSNESYHQTVSGKETCKTCIRARKAAGNFVASDFKSGRSNRNKDVQP